MPGTVTNPVRLQNVFRRIVEVGWPNERYVSLLVNLKTAIISFTSESAVSPVTYDPAWSPVSNSYVTSFNYYEDGTSTWAYRSGAWVSVSAGEYLISGLYALPAPNVGLFSPSAWEVIFGGANPFDASQNSDETSVSIDPGGSVGTNALSVPLQPGVPFDEGASPLIKLRHGNRVNTTARKLLDGGVTSNWYTVTGYPAGAPVLQPNASYPVEYVQAGALITHGTRTFAPIATKAIPSATDPYNPTGTLKLYILFERVTTSG